MVVGRWTALTNRWDGKPLEATMTWRAHCKRVDSISKKQTSLGLRKGVLEAIPGKKTEIKPVGRNHI